jgi:hypothetical protein
MKLKPWPAAALLALMILPIAACASQYGVVLTSGTSAARAPRPAVPAADGLALFQEKDADRDGAIAPAELATGLDVGAREAAQLFVLLDRDADGRLTPAEYFPDPGQVHVVTRHVAHAAEASR